MRVTRVLLTAIALSLALEGSAAAQAMFTASLGNVFGGDAPSKKTVWAVAIGGGGAHAIGSELEYAETRNFFETATGVGEGKVTTVMPSIFVAVPISRVRPYGIFGFGLIRARRQANSGGAFTNITDNDFGYNVGGGVTLMFAQHAGVRADLRRFKVRASDGISFHRFTVGLVLGG